MGHTVLLGLYQQHTFPSTSSSLTLSWFFSTSTLLVNKFTKWSQQTVKTSLQHPEVSAWIGNWLKSGDLVGCRHGSPINESWIFKKVDEKEIESNNGKKKSWGSRLLTWNESCLRRRLWHHQAAQGITVGHNSAVSTLRHCEGLLEIVLVLGLPGGRAA